MSPERIVVQMRAENHRIRKQFVETALLFLVLAVAILSNVFTVIGVAIAGLAFSFREVLLLTLSRGLAKNSAQFYPYGIGKSLRAGDLITASGAIAAGFWLAGQAFGLILSGLSEATPFGFALAAAANALVLIWNGFVAYAHYDPDEPVWRHLLRVRRRCFAALLALQIMLTVVVLAKDPVIALWIDILGATFISFVMIIGGVKAAWESISDLIDHPLDSERERAIITLLFQEGIKPDEFIEMRTRRCDQRIFVELTLRIMESLAVDNLRQRLVGLRRALETEVKDLDLTIRLRGHERDKV